MFELIQNQPLEFADEYWSGVSNDAKDFVNKLLDKNPKTRSTAEEALNHSWIKNLAQLSNTPQTQMVF